jgi:hypothetical protein
MAKGKTSFGRQYLQALNQNEWPQLRRAEITRKSWSIIGPEVFVISAEGTGYFHHDSSHLVVEVFLQC